MKEFPYLKLFTQARNDPKLRALYKGSPAHFWVWFNLFCYSGEQPEPGRGKVARPLFLVAVEVADGDVDLLRNACNAMGALQLVSCDISDPQNAVIEIRNFHKWQEKRKPSDAPESVAARVAKHRDGKKKGKDGGRGRGVTRGVTPCNAPVTPECNAIKEADAEEDKEEKPPLRGGEKAAPPDAGAGPVVNPAADVDRVAGVADDLFPLMDFGIKVRQLQAHYRMDCLEAALFRTHEKGKREWSYVSGAYRGIVAEGGPRPAQTPASARPPAHGPTSASVLAAANRVQAALAAEEARGDR